MRAVGVVATASVYVLFRGTSVLFNISESEKFSAEVLFSLIRSRFSKSDRQV